MSHVYNLITEQTIRVRSTIVVDHELSDAQLRAQTAPVDWRQPGGVIHVPLDGGIGSVIVLDVVDFDVLTMDERYEPRSLRPGPTGARRERQQPQPSPASPSRVDDDTELSAQHPDGSDPVGDNLGRLT